MSDLGVYKQWKFYDSADEVINKETTPHDTSFTYRTSPSNKAPIGSM